MALPGRDRRLALLASGQAGAFTFAQALELGFPSSTIGDRLRSGTWCRAVPGVFTVGGAMPSRRQELWVARLAVGPAGVLTHETAALCHGAERLPERPVILTVPHRGHHRIPGVFVHQIDDLHPWHRTTKDGLPVSTPARVVVELGATQPEHMIGLVADDLVRLRRTTYEQIARVFSEVARPGKPGMLKVAAVLDERGPGSIPPHSELERLLFDTLAAGGLPAPDRQVPLPGRGRIRGIADGAYLDARIVLEVDGRRWHDRVRASHQDRLRDICVVRAGWVTMRFDHRLIVGDPAELCSAVREARAERLSLFQRAA